MKSSGNSFLTYPVCELPVLTGAVLLAALVLLLILPFGLRAQENLRAQDSGWQADPALVAKNEQQRPKYLWREAKVAAYELPDPLLSTGGKQVANPDEWKQRRKEILELFRSKMYGRRPGAPQQLAFMVTKEDTGAMDGVATLRQITVQSRYQGRSHQFHITLFLPNETQQAVPVFLLLNNRGVENTDPSRQEKSDFWPAEEVIERGYGIAAIQNNELAPDDEEHYQEGVIRLFEGEVDAGQRAPDAWGALAAWGWGASRAMDYFETDPRIDASKIAILGHSRGGKAALWAGAEDDRFALVISNDSGCGGAALSRRRYGETLSAVNRFGHWFNANFKAFNDREDELPFDQHMLLALIAPRALYVASANEDLWADPRGEFLSLVHASPVYGLWGETTISAGDMPPLNQPLIVGSRAYHIRPGVHNLTGTDWQYYMDFADQLWGRKFD